MKRRQWGAYCNPLRMPLRQKAGLPYGAQARCLNNRLSSIYVPKSLAVLFFVERGMQVIRDADAEVMAPALGDQIWSLLWQL